MSTKMPASKQWMFVPCVMALVLSACTGSASSATTSADTQTRAAQLALGTIGLEGTAQAVDAAAASQLLPMWELYSDLNQSTTAAPEELAATVTAIEAAMTAEQLAAIGEMQLSETEMAAATRPAGAAAMPAAVSASAGMDPALAMEMGVDGGGMPMDGGAPPSAGAASRGASGPLVASAQAAGGSSGVFERVITLLASKTQHT